jgi:hypothetical protein
LLAFFDRDFDFYDIVVNSTGYRRVTAAAKPQALIRQHDNVSGDLIDFSEDATVHQQNTSALYVRALYNFESDDRTSLTFRIGDIVKVVSQLENGNSDGVVHGVRGWFPSSYCMAISIFGFSMRTDPSSEEDPGQSEDLLELRFSVDLRLVSLVAHCDLVRTLTASVGTGAQLIAVPSHQPRTTSDRCR